MVVVTFVRLLSVGVLITLCYLGDVLVVLNSSHGVKLHALTDNLVHGTLAVIVWLLGYFTFCFVTDTGRLSTNNLATHTIVILQSVVCGAFACLVDLDHFLAARSLELEDAVNAPHRGILHNSLLLLLLMACYHSKPRSIVVLLLVALSTHQLRDSLRRGLYFYPLGSTAPLPYTLYIALMCGVMLTFRYFIPGSVRIVSRSATCLKEV